MKAERCVIAPERREELLSNLSFYVLVQNVSITVEEILFLDLEVRIVYKKHEIKLDKH